MTSFTLRIIAIITMAIDHIGAYLFPEQFIFRLIGRIAFPIFAYQIVEGYTKTHDVKAYMKRILVFALISEIPFDLIGSQKLIDLHAQNILFTFFTSLMVIYGIDRVRSTKTSDLSKALASIIIIFLGFSVANAFLLDYYGFGVLLCLAFYTSKSVNKKWQELLIIFIGMFLVNWVLMGGLKINLVINNFNLLIPVQGFAMISFIPISLYNGKLGYSNTLFRHICYWFYPAHLLIIYLIGLI